MKAIFAPYTFTATASTTLAGYSPANVSNFAPGKRWRAGAHDNEYIDLDLGSVKEITAVYLGNANFRQCALFTSADGYDWVLVDFYDIGQDDAGQRKRWIETNLNTRYLSIDITFGILDYAEATPAVGNIIIGAAQTLPSVTEWTPQTISKFDTFISDGGTFTKTPKGKQRHTFSWTSEGTLSEIDVIPRSWLNAVFFEDMNGTAQAWLVYRPESFTKPFRSLQEASLKCQLEERV